MKLIAKRPIGKRHVFDITVPDTHNFVASGVVVHNCVNYKVSQYVTANIESDRLLTHASDNRDHVYRQHVASTEPTVLVSPSMTEGVDLADEASRFQIICKIPFPYLGDEVVKKRMSKDSTWYTYQTVKTIVQSVGRSVRNERDHAVTYILDLDWERFYKQNRRFFPVEFIDAIVST